MIVTLVLSFLACAPSADAPAISDVSPAWGWTGEATNVVIGGQNFFPDLVVTAGGPDEGQVDASFTAVLERGADHTALTGVQTIDYSTLAATVPAGIAPGAYDLRVTTPAGATAMHAGAFIVTTTRADHLDLVVSDAAYEVSELANVDISLLDPSGGQVAQPLVVEVRAASDIDAVGVRFEGAGLTEMTPTEDGQGVVGGLAADGTARLLVTSDLPDDVTLSVTPVVDGGADASVIRSDSLLLSFDAGDLADVRLTLPNDPFVTTAGAAWDLDLTLLDKHGNVLADTASRVLLTEDCGDWKETVDVKGTATVSVATTSSCPANRIHVLNQSIDVASAEFQVRPGTMSQYLVQATPPTVEAGADPALALVTAADAYGNVYSDYTGSITLSDSAGGLDLTRSHCPSFSGGLALCTVYLDHADPALLITATDELGRTGTSGPIRVTPGPVSNVQVIPLETEIVAGDTMTVLVVPEDVYGNPIAIEPGGADPVVLSDDEGPLSCTWTGPSGSGQSFLCMFTAANPSATVTASILSIAAAGTSALSVSVTNGPLAAIDIGLSSPPFSAGDPFAVTLRGYDEWNNPYVVQLDPIVALADSTGTITPNAAGFGTDGTVVTAVTLTGAGGGVTITASQGGVVLGTSPSFVVGAATPVTYRVTAPPWIDIDEGGEIQVLAYDAYGNASLDYTGSVELTSTLGFCEDAVIGGFSSGVGVANVTCTSSGLADRWAAAGTDGLTGTSNDVDVVDFACASGPTAVLSLEGSDDATVCLVSGLATITADASGSGGGAVLHHFGESDGTDVRTLSDTEDVTWASAGIREVTLLAVGADGCAAADAGWVYVGESDGEAAGVVSVSADAASVNTLGSTTITISAVDCTGDVAAGQSLLVRADLGEPDLVGSGSGLTVALDSSGEASFDWDFPEGYVGTATLLAGSESGGAFGATSVLVAADGARPHVVSVDPMGVTSGIVTAITVDFDEDMLATSISGATLTGPAGAVSLTPTLSGSSLTLTPASAVDADSGVWTLSLASSFRDLAGNKLDGQWSGLASAFSVEFGAVVNETPLIGACPPSASRFLPDGDDGLGEEADSVSLTPTASGAPEWWRLVVTAGDGSGIRTLHTAGTDTAITWDGRADDGHVVASQTYALDLYPIDAHGNVGDACGVDIVVAQRVDEP